MKTPGIIYTIDDDDIYQFTAALLIESCKLNAKHFSFLNGQEAIRCLIESAGKHENIPDIILLDINMPVMDGWQFMKEFAKIKSTIRKEILVCMVSSSLNPVDRHRAKEVQEITEYINKPLTKEKIEYIIGNYEQFTTGITPVFRKK